MKMKLKLSAVVWVMAGMSMLWAASGALAQAVDVSSLEAQWRAGKLEAKGYAVLIGHYQRQKGEAAKATAGKLVADMWGRFLSRPEYATEAKAGELLGLAEAGLGHYTDEQKKQLSASLEKRFTADTKLLAGMNIWGAGKACDLLARLQGGSWQGNAACERVMVAWTAARGEKWKDEPAYLLALHANRLLGCKGEQGKAASARVMDHIWQTYFKPGLVYSAETLTMTTYVKGGLSGQQREQLGAELKRQFVSSRTAMGQMSAANMGELCRTLALVDGKPVDESPSASSARIAWINASDQWQSLPPRSLATMAAALADSGDAAAPDALRRLAAHVWKTSIEDDGYWKSSTPQQMVGLATALAPVLTAERKKTLAGRLDAELVGRPDRLKRLSVFDLFRADGTLATLDGRASGGVVAEWVAAGADLESLGNYQLSRVRSALQRSESPRAKQALGQLSGQVWGQTLGDATFVKSAETGELLNLTEIMLSTLDGGQKEQLLASYKAQVTGDKARLATMSAGEAVKMAMLLDRLSGTHPRASAAGAAAVVAWMDASDSWREAAPAAMLQLRQALAVEEASAVRHSQMVATRLGEKHLANLESARTADPVELAQAVAAGREALSAEQKAELRGVIQGRFVDDRAALVKLSLYQLRSVHSSLRALGDGEPAAIPRWVQAGTTLKECTVFDIAQLLGALRESGTVEAEQALEVLTEHVWTTRLARAEAYSLEQAMDQCYLAELFRGRLGTERCDQVRRTLAGRYLADKASLKALEFGQVLRMSRTIAWLAGEDAGRSAATVDAVVQWAGAHPDWTQMSAAQLLLMGARLQTADSHEARQLAAQSVKILIEQRLGKPEGMSVQEVRGLVDAARGGMYSLEPEDYRRILEVVVQAVGRPEVLAGLDVSAALKLTEVTGPLERHSERHEGVSARILGEWVLASDAWRSADAAHLVRVAHVLTRCEGEAQRQAIGKIADRLHTEYLNREDYLQTAPQEELLDVVAVAAAVCDEKVKARAREALQSRFAGDGRSLAAMNFSNASRLGSVLGQLGDGREAVLIDWVNGGASLEKLSHAQISGLRSKLAGASGKGAGEALNRVVEFIWSSYLGNKTYWASGNLKDLLWLTETTAPQLSAARKHQLAQGLLDKYANDQAVCSRLPLGTIRGIVIALSLLDRQPEAVEALSKWVVAGKANRFASEEATRTMLGWLISGPISHPDKRQIVEAVEGVWAGLHEHKQLDLASYQTMARAWAWVGDPEKGRKWALMHVEAMVGSGLEEGTAEQRSRALREVGRTLFEQQLTGEGKGYEEFAKSLAAFIRGGGDVQGANFTARPLGSEPARRIVMAELTDGQGQVRYAAAEVLTYAYVQSGKLAFWKTYLDSKVANPGLGGDQKAGWLVARSFAESIPAASALAGQEYLNRAFAAAGSESIRLDILNRLVGGYIAIQQYDRAAGLLRSLQGQLTSEAGRRAVAAGLERVEARKQAYAKHLAGFRQKETDERTRLYIEELKRRLAAAQSRGDQEETDRYERLLQSLQ